jgi:hypothetical protein
MRRVRNAGTEPTRTDTEGKGSGSFTLRPAPTTFLSYAGEALGRTTLSRDGVSGLLVDPEDARRDRDCDRTCLNGQRPCGRA